MKTVGYLEGTDPLFLSRLTLAGIYTLPLSNGIDNHGKYIGLISSKDNVGAIVGHLHKFLILPYSTSDPCDPFYACNLHNIPLLVVVPDGQTEQGQKMLQEKIYPNGLTSAECVDESTLWQKVMETLGA